jgi:hypothetical protein
MNARLESLARQKQALLDQSGLYRLRLRRDASALRNSVTWKRTSIAAVAKVPAVRAIAWSMGLSMLGIGRTARVLVFASRAILLIKLARAAIGYARAPVERARNYLA